MSLRLRFSLLYTSLLGGVLLLFGGLVYGLVSVILLNQIDYTLTQEAPGIDLAFERDLCQPIRSSSAAMYEPTQNILIQFWDTGQNLLLARPALLQSALDGDGLHSGVPVFHSVETNAQYYLRVLSVPVTTARGTGRRASGGHEHGNRGGPAAFARGCAGAAHPGGHVHQRIGDLVCNRTRPGSDIAC